jgi:predicted permease
LIRFGGVTQSRERHREVRGWPALDVLIQDLRYTLRTLRRDPGFALIAVLMLGLGIGANVAVFSVVNGILLRPLPLHNSGRLVWMEQANGRTGLSDLTYSVDAYEEFRDRNRSFQSVTGYFAFSQPDNYNLTGYGEPLPATAISVVGNFFRTLGVEPHIGRLFTAEECQRNGRAAVLLAYPFWKRQFAGDSKIVGRTIDLNGRPVTVAGVLPDSFDFGSIFLPGERVDMFVPAILDEMQNWGNTLALIGRLKPGASLARAQAEANILAPDLYWSVKHPSSKGYTAKLMPLKEYVSGRLRRSLIVLWSAVGFILLIVCVNLSNLLLARAGARSKEFAMRAALGAGRGRLIRQLLTESLVLSAAGATFGLGFAYATTALFCGAGCGFRRLRAAAGSARHLRRDLILSNSADAGNRNTHGVGSDGRTRAGEHTLADVTAGCGGCRRTIASVAVSRLIGSLLFETAPTDAITFVGTVVLLGLGGAACRICSGTTGFARGSDDRASDDMRKRCAGAIRFSTAKRL